MFSKKENKKYSTPKAAGSKVRNYGNEQYFVEKAEAAKRVIEKYGLPKELQTGKK
jgi:ribosome biogenesis SPOUT family RNA methylase Rps3